MHLDLVDLFRCIRSHDDSGLVAASDRTEERVILSGVLGCPVCGTEYPITHGVTRFDGGIGAPAEPMAASQPERISDDNALRTAALLDATDRTRLLLFIGAPLMLVRSVQELTGARAIAVNPPDEANAMARPLADDPPLAVVRLERAAPRLPLTSGVITGVWLHAMDDAGLLVTALPATRASARIVAPVSLPVPEDVRVLVRDDEVWVGESMIAPIATPMSLTPLRRRTTGR